MIKTTLSAVGNYVTNVGIGIDMTLNAFLGGSPWETLSSRAWRNRDHKYWHWCYRFINGIFFLQENHCKQSFERRIESAIRSIEHGGKP